MRALIETLQRAEARFSESIWGDLLGAVCLVIIMLGAMMVPMVLS